MSELSMIYKAGILRKPPKGKQKFQPGERVRIAKDLGPSMRHFSADKDATVQYTYSQRFGGDSWDSYSLLIDGVGSVAWYDEDQLTAIQCKK